MKIHLKNAEMKNRIFHLLFIFFIGLTTIPGVKCQEKITFDYDYLMPQKGKSMVELYTGFPYVAIGQYSYGFSNRFSVGIIYGYTPFVRGYGLRIKSVIAQPSKSMRIYMKSPLIYYPKMQTGEVDPWVLAWPTMNVEWKLKNGGRVWTGVGLIGAACTEFFFKPKDGHEEYGPDHEPGTEKDEVMANLWNTFQIGYSKPVSKKLSYVIEIAPVMEGLKIKSPDGFLDGAPVIVTLGLSYSF